MEHSPDNRKTVPVVPHSESVAGEEDPGASIEPGEFRQAGDQDTAVNAPRPPLWPPGVTGRQPGGAGTADPLASPRAK